MTDIVEKNAWCIYDKSTNLNTFVRLVAHSRELQVLMYMGDYRCIQFMLNQHHIEILHKIVVKYKERIIAGLIPFNVDVYSNVDGIEECVSSPLNVVSQRGITLAFPIHFGGGPTVRIDIYPSNISSIHDSKYDYLYFSTRAFEAFANILEQVHTSIPEEVPTSMKPNSTQP